TASCARTETSASCSGWHSAWALRSSSRRRPSNGAATSATSATPTDISGRWRHRRRSSQSLGEPMMGVGLVVESLDLPVTGAAVERDSFFEGAVRLQADRARTVPAGEAFELQEEPSSEA